MAADVLGFDLGFSGENLPKDDFTLMARELIAQGRSYQQIAQLSSHHGDLVDQFRPGDTLKLLAGSCWPFIGSDNNRHYFSESNEIYVTRLRDPGSIECACPKSHTWLLRHRQLVVRDQVVV